MMVHKLINRRPLSETSAEDLGIMYIIKLQLEKPNNTLEHVRHIRGLSGLDIDEDYGVVSISPKRGLYVVRVSDDIDINKVRALPEVTGVYGDMRIDPINKGDKNLEK